MAPAVPGFLAATAHAAGPEKDGRILVVVQLDGGNDGINTVVPFKDEGYAKSRKAIRLPPISCTRSTMRSACTRASPTRGSCWNRAGWRSFRASDIRTRAVRTSEAWRSGRSARRGEHSGLGWVGRGFDEGSTARDAQAPPSWASGQLPAAAIRPARHSGGARPARRQCPDRQGRARRAGRSATLRRVTTSAQFLRRSLLDAYTTADRRGREGPRRGRGDGGIPRRGARPSAEADGAADQGRGWARGSITSSREAMTPTANNSARTRPLLEELSASLRAFLDDLAAAGWPTGSWCWPSASSAGQRAENGSKGTDHGTAGPVFLAGPHVRPGLDGAYPSLPDLVDGDLKMAVDFRRVYATVLQDWLALPTARARRAVRPASRDPDVTARSTGTFPIRSR